MKRTFVISALLLLAILSAWIVSSVRTRPSSETDSARQFSSNPMVQKVLEIEAQEKHQDESTWAKEILAQQFEETVVQLWDKLKDSPDKFSVLIQFPIQELILGTNPDWKEHQHGIRRGRFQNSRVLNFVEWTNLLDGWRRDFRIEQVEFRHVDFVPRSQNAGARSTFWVRADVAGPGKKLMLHGLVEVEWKKQSPGQAGVHRIDGIKLEVSERAGQDFFRELTLFEITPPSGSFFIDPLLVYDFDADGFSEIVLGNKNVVYRRNSEGKYSPKTFCTVPPSTAFAGLIEHFNEDGKADYLCADSHGLLLFLSNEGGQFLDAGSRVWQSQQRLMHPQVLTAGDVDRDGDLDLWLAQYKTPYQSGQMPTPFYDANDGFPSFLLINNGRGQFEDQTEKRGLARKRFRRSYSSSFIDYDNDADLDLLVVSDFAGVDLYRNDGAGNFTDLTDSLFKERHLLGMSHAFGDLNEDGRVDFLAVGMNSPLADRLQGLKLTRPGAGNFLEMLTRVATGNRLFLSSDDAFHEAANQPDLNRTGWSWGAGFFDFDNDRDLDLYVVNGHESNRTVRDYEPQFWLHDIFVGRSQSDPVANIYFKAVGGPLRGGGQSYGGYEKNRLLLNEHGKFLEIGYLLGLGLEADCRNLAIDDLDGDGRKDVVLLTHEIWPRRRQTLRIFQNQFPFKAENNWIGFRLLASGRNGIVTSGTKLELVTKKGIQTQWLVTGDSYRSQSSSTVHFGLGELEEVSEAILYWPNGTRQKLPSPAINRYHWVTPASR